MNRNPSKEEMIAYLRKHWYWGTGIAADGEDNELPDSGKIWLYRKKLKELGVDYKPLTLGPIR